MLNFLNKIYKFKENKYTKWILTFLFSWNIAFDNFIFGHRSKAKGIFKLFLFIAFLAFLFMSLSFGGNSNDQIVVTKLPFGGFFHPNEFKPISSVPSTFLILAIICIVINCFVVLLELPSIIFGKAKDLKFHKITSNNTEKTASYNEELAKALVQELGGLENFENVDACITKLRITVKNSQIILKDRNVYQKKYHALGFLQSGRGVQIAYGALAEVLKGIILDFKNNPSIMKDIKDWNVDSNSKDMNNKVLLNSKKHFNTPLFIKKPINGKVQLINKCVDELFANKAMGDGVIIIPKEGKVFAPFDGRIVSTFPTGHAYGLEASDGTQVLIHIGIDSYKEPNIFKAKVKQGDKVKMGDLLCEFNLDKLKKNAKSIQTPFIVMNETIGSRKIKINLNGEKIISLLKK